MVKCMPCRNQIPCVIAGRVAPLVPVADSATSNRSLSAGQSNHQLDTASNQELEPGKLAKIQLGNYTTLKGLQ